MLLAPFLLLLVPQQPFAEPPGGPLHRREPAALPAQRAPARDYLVALGRTARLARAHGDAWLARLLRRRMLRLEHALRRRLRCFRDREQGRRTLEHEWRRPRERRPRGGAGPEAAAGIERQIRALERQVERLERALGRAAPH